MGGMGRSWNRGSRGGEWLCPSLIGRAVTLLPQCHMLAVPVTTTRLAHSAPPFYPPQHGRQSPPLAPLPPRLETFVVIPMHQARVRDLWCCLGTLAGNLLVHAGCCEHVMAVVDVRLPHADDDLRAASYPKVVCRPKQPAMACQTCRVSERARAECWCHQMCRMSERAAVLLARLPDVPVECEHECSSVTHSSSTPH